MSDKVIPHSKTNERIEKLRKELSTLAEKSLNNEEVHRLSEELDAELAKLFTVPRK